MLPVIERAQHFVSAKVPDNALALLSTITSSLVGGCERPGFDDDSRAVVEELFTALEVSWQSLLEALPLDTVKATEWFREIGKWRTTLTPHLGPMFSDCLRDLTKRMKDKGDSANGGAAAAAASDPPAKKQKS